MEVFYIVGGPSSGGASHISKYSIKGELLGRNTDSSINGVGGAVDPKTNNPFWTNFSNGTILTCPAEPDANKVLGPVTAWMSGLTTYGNNESMLFRGDKVWMGSADGNKLVEIDYATKTVTRVLTVPINRGTDWITLHPDGKTMYYTGETATIRRWDTETNTALPNFAYSGGGGSFYSVMVSQNTGNIFVTASAGTTFLYGPDGVLIRSFTMQPNMQGFATALTVDEKTLIVGDYQSDRVWIVNVDTGEGTAAPAFTQGGYKSGGIFSIGGTQKAQVIVEARTRVVFNKGRA